MPPHLKRVATVCEICLREMKKNSQERPKQTATQD